MLFPEMSRYDEPFVSTCDANKDRLLMIDWWMNVYIPEGRGVEKTSFQTYQTWCNGIWGLFKYVSTGSGYVPEVNQQSVTVSLVKRDPLEPQLSEFNMWLPHIKTIPDKGYKYINIMEKTLSEFGCYYLHVYENRFDLMFMSYRNEKLLKSFAVAADCLDYIRENDYYEKGKKNGC